MAKRSSQSVQKRQRERRKAEKAAAKRERKALKKAMAVAIEEGRLPEGTELPEDAEQLEALIEQEGSKGTETGEEDAATGGIESNEAGSDDLPDPEAGKTD